MEVTTSETPLYSAIRGNNKADVQLLLKNNADANFQNPRKDTPLHVSTGEGFSDISQLLIDGGCKVNESNDEVKRHFILLFVATIKLMFSFC